MTFLLRFSLLRHFFVGALFFLITLFASVDYHHLHSFVAGSTTVIGHMKSRTFSKNRYIGSLQCASPFKNFSIFSQTSGQFPNISHERSLISVRLFGNLIFLSITKKERNKHEYLL